MTEKEQKIADRLLDATDRALNNSDRWQDACLLVRSYIDLKHACSPRANSLDSSAAQETT